MPNDLREIVNEIAGQMGHFHQMLARRADELESVGGGDTEVAEKLMKGADAMKDSANIYLSWARHYVTLSEGGASESEEGEEDSADFQF